MLQDMSGKLTNQKTEILEDVSGMLAQQKTDMMQNVSSLIATELMPQFSLLGEDHQAIIEKLVPASRIDELEEEVKFLKIIVKQLSEDLQLLRNEQ